MTSTKAAAKASQTALLLTNTEICDSCSNCAYDECPEADPEVHQLINLQIGEELPDHLCDQDEAPTLNCACGCRTAKLFPLV